MQTTSADYKTAISALDREIKGYIKFNNTFTLSGAGGLIDFKVTQNAMDAERFCVGSVTSCFCEATFYNEGLEGSGVSLPNSYFDAYIGVVTDPSNDTVEYVCCGRFYVSEITRSTATTRILGYDIAGRLSMDYVPTVTPDPDDGYLVMDILNDIIDQTGVNGGVHFTTFGDSNYVPEIYSGNCRAQWGWLSSLVTAKATSYSGTRDPADLGYVKEYYTGNGEVNPYAVDEDTTYMDGLAQGATYTITSFTTGTTENPIVIGNGTGLYGLNPYMDNATATTIEGTLHNYTYYPTTLRWRGDPALDILDEINVTKGADTYKLVCMKIVTTFNGGLEQTISCYGDSEEYYAMSTSPTQGEINRVSNLVGEIQQAIETADRGVCVKILDTDGTWKEFVIANNKDLDQATSVWRWNINGLAHSNRYSGGTYTFALDAQGRLIANVIQTGILQDAAGKNSWNLDTGELIITDGSITATYTDPNIFYRADYDADPDISTNQDMLDLRAIILRGAPFSDAELAKYDFNGSGTLTNADLVKLRNMILADKDLVASRTAVIDPRLVTVIKVWNTQLRDTPMHTTEQSADGYVASYESYDADGNAIGERMSLEGTGLFGYTNGVETSAYPNGVNFNGDLSPYSSRGTINYAVARKWGRFRYINIIFAASYNGSSSTARIIDVGADNTPSYGYALSCVDVTNGSSYVDASIPCKVGTTGGIYANAVTNGHLYCITGLYFVGGQND